MDREDLAQITDSLSRAVEADPARARQAILDFGWRELLDDDEAAAVSTLFRLQGERLLDATFLDEVFLHAAGIDVPEGTRVAMPRPGRHLPTSRLDQAATVLADGLVQRGSGAVMIPALEASGATVLVLADAHVDSTGACEPLDPAAGWAVFRAELPVERTVASGNDAELAWTGMVAAGRRALAYELIGVGDRMVAMTIEHVTERHQFGQPLGAFQAVKHQLADVHLWQQAATLAAEMASEDPDPTAAALANASALRFTKAARATCQQLLGGMGFTREHDFHRYLRRALTLEPLLGEAADLHAELGAALRAGAVPDSLASL